MSDVQTGGDGGGHGKHQKKRAKKSSTRIDMTPMVDLAFLLLTFFVLTSTFSKPTTMEITMPVKDEKDTNKVKKAITILLTEDDKVFYYTGVLKEETEVNESSFDNTKGLRKVIFDLNKKYIDEIKGIEKELQRLVGKLSEDSIQKLFDARKLAVHKRTDDDATWTVIIKPDDKASYRSVINVVDEMSICQIGKYAIVDISDSEIDLLTKINPK